MFPNLAALLRKVGRLEATRNARAAPPPPPGLDAAGLALWAQWSAELAALQEGRAWQVKMAALEEMDAELVGIACRVRGMG
jgi:hypothetical protein